jgi:hypothetical protein
MNEFPVRRVDISQRRAIESLGTKPKFWLLDDNKRLLFKADDRGTGEDWAEVITSHLCELMGLPHVEYELALECDGELELRPGVVCANMAPPPNWLVLGNQLLLARDRDYPTEQRFKVRQHTVAAISELVQVLHAPSIEWCNDVPTEVKSTVDFFAGYLLLDAWVANQDRHHENWAAIWHSENAMMRLAPTFDHGAALARNLTDNERADRMSTRDFGRSIARFAEKARGAIFECSDDDKPLGLLETFQAFGKLVPEAACAWLDRLDRLDSGLVRAIVDRVPESRMSTTTKDFTVELLATNHKRLSALSKDFR